MRPGRRHLAEEADLERTLAKTWGADGETSRNCMSTDRLLAETGAGRTSHAPAGPDIATLAAAGWDPGVGDGAPLVRQIDQLLVDGYRVTVGADGAGSAERVQHLLADHGVHFGLDADADLTRPGGHITVAPLERGFILPSAKLAVLSEERRHRSSSCSGGPDRKQAAQGFFDDLTRVTASCLTSAGARYGGMVKRAIGGVDRRLSAARIPRRRSAPCHRSRSTPFGTTAESPTLTDWVAPIGEDRVSECVRLWPRSRKSWWSSTKRA